MTSFVIKYKKIGQTWICHDIVILACEAVFLFNSRKLRASESVLTKQKARRTTSPSSRTVEPNHVAMKWRTTTEAVLRNKR